MDVSSKSAFLAAEHCRNVAEFIEAVVSIVPGDLGIEERHELEAKVRFQVENGLVPGAAGGCRVPLGSQSAGPEPGFAPVDRAGVDGAAR